MHARHPLQWQRERCDRGAFGRGVAATPLLHTQNCGTSRDRGIATPWSATGGGVASAPLIRTEKAAQRVSFGARYPADVHADIPADVRGQKLRSGRTEILEKRAFRGADIHDPDAGTSMTPRGF